MNQISIDNISSYGRISKYSFNEYILNFSHITFDSLILSGVLELFFSDGDGQD